MAMAKAMNAKDADEKKVTDFFSNTKAKKESLKVKQYFKDFPVKLLVFIYNTGLFAIVSAIVVFMFIVCVGLDVILPPMLLGFMGYDLSAASAINTMAMLAIVMLMSGTLLMLMYTAAKVLFKKVFNKYKLVTERNEETGKLRAVKNNK